MMDLQKSFFWIYCLKKTLDSEELLIVRLICYKWEAVSTFWWILFLLERKLYEVSAADIVVLFAIINSYR